MSEMKYCAMFLLVVASAMALQAETWKAVSPDGKNEIRLTADRSLTVEVFRAGKPVIAPTGIGLRFEGRALGANSKVAGVEPRLVNETIKTPIYKKSAIANRAHETKVSFEGDWSVTLHAADDGVAYRFETAFKDEKVKVLDERCDFALPNASDEIYCALDWHGKDDPLQNSWENIYWKKPISEVCTRKDARRITYLPMTRVTADFALCFTESDLRDYPGLNFVHSSTQANLLQARLARFPVPSKDNVSGRKRLITARTDYLVETAGARTYPWRVFLLADSVAKLVESDRVFALAAPSAIGECAWVRPGLVQWDWWNAWNVSGVPFRAGCNTETYKHYVDFAAKNGVRYVILDEGWAVDLDIFKIKPEVDVKEIIRYARARKVEIILWCAWAQMYGREEEACKMFAGLGAAGLKIDFMDRDDAELVNFLERTAKIAAKYRLLVDYHGMYKPTGLQRTYPNIVNFEGVHGLEQMKWEKDSDFPRNDCTLAFTRMLAGPMDYTPGAMINCTKKEFRPIFDRPASQGTRCHQMALMALYEAPLQMLADSPSNYAKNQECFDFMKATPTVWDETIGLAGEMERFAAVARRKGTVWYVAAIGDWSARELSLPLPFLSKGGRAEIFADGLNADRCAEDYAHFAKLLKAGEPLKVKLAPGGGFIARIEPEF